MTRQVVYQGVKIQVARDLETMPDSRVVQRDVVLHPGAVVILPLVDVQRVCLLRNRRPIVGETLLELPAGTLEPGEDPAAAAVRELAEETGYRARRWRKLTEFYPSPGVLSVRSRLYLAEELTPGAPSLEPDEEIVTEIVLPPAAGVRSAYRKLRRRGSFDFPVLGVAAALRMDGDRVAEARIVLGAVASLPREAPEAARLLVGERLTAEVIDRAADAAYRPAKPLDNTDLTHPYRKKMTRVYVARALRSLAGLPEAASA